jgi:hypothetical protein
MEAIRCALGGDIDVPPRTQRSGSYPKHMLFPNPFDERFGYFIVVLSHGDYLASLVPVDLKISINELLVGV